MLLLLIAAYTRIIANEMIRNELFSMIVKAGGYNDLQAFAATYQGEDDFMMIWDYYQKHVKYVKNVNPGWQHELMAKNYVDYLAKGLKDLHPSLS